MGCAGNEGVTDGLKVGGDLTSEHFDETRAVHTNCLALVGEGLLRNELTALVYRGHRGNCIRVVERDEVEALPEYKDVGDFITTASGERQVVATGTGICVWSG